jgi:hypothetical protein
MSRCTGDSFKASEAEGVAAHAPPVVEAKSRPNVWPNHGLRATKRIERSFVLSDEVDIAGNPLRGVGINRPAKRGNMSQAERFFGLCGRIG